MPQADNPSQDRSRSEEECNQRKKEKGFDNPLPAGETQLKGLFFGAIIDTLETPVAFVGMDGLALMDPDVCHAGLGASSAIGACFRISPNLGQTQDTEPPEKRAVRTEVSAPEMAD